MTGAQRPSTGAAVAVREVSKAYGATAVLTGVDLDIAAGTVTAILGASGSGKTTLLRLIAGFDTADRGRITIAGNVVDDGDGSVRAQRRGVGYVPQDAALFPHLSVAGNVGFGVARRQRRARVADMLDMVGLAGLGHRYPHQLSGGQRQRIALARALATRPSVVLLDEPFGSLDARLRDTVRGEVLGILRTTGTTTVLVTHDQDEALAVADRIALLQAGRIVAHGTPPQLYEHPATPDIATAIGTANILPGHCDDRTAVCVFGQLVRADAPDSPRSPARAPAGTRACRILIRPEQLTLHAATAAHPVIATVVDVRYHGHDTLVELRTDAPAVPARLTARINGTSPLAPGQTVGVSVAAAVHVWPAR